ncbi:hypothetical protein [Salinarimonas sp.]|uniref:hypothetical protein n=1 Tax=Salinarimonas sp. TaxID=2766526 RepID=UPI0032D9419E
MSAGTPPVAPPPSLPAIFGEAGVLTAYAAALAYVAGWSYADRWFAELGIGLSELDGFGVEDVAVYALWVLRDAWAWSLGFLALAVGLLVALWRWRGRLGGGPEPVALGAVVLALASLLGAAQLGAMRASDQVERLFETGYVDFPRIAVIPLPESPLQAVLGPPRDIGASTCLREIFADRTNVYAYLGYAPPPSAPPPARPDILVLPRAEIAYVRIVTGVADLCERPSTESPDPPAAPPPT